MNYKIVTHDGTAHRDEFLACCFLLARLDGEIELERKQQPSVEDLADENVFVVDFGRQFDESLRNFDHHQFTGGNVCAFTLILDYFGFRNYDALPWISFVETFDHSGPKKAQQIVGSNDPDFHSLLYDPCLETFLELFSGVTSGSSNNFIRNAMTLIGDKIVNEHNNYFRYKNELAKVKAIESSGLLIADFTDVDPVYFSKNAEQDFFKIYDNFDLKMSLNTRGDDEYIIRRLKETLDLNEAKAYAGFVHQSGFLATFDAIRKLDLITQSLTK